MIDVAIEFRESVLCEICSNVHRGAKLAHKTICLDRAGDDPELVKKIMRAVMPELAAGGHRSSSSAGS